MCCELAQHVNLNIASGGGKSCEYHIHTFMARDAGGNAVAYIDERINYDELIYHATKIVMTTTYVNITQKCDTDYHNTGRFVVYS